MAFEDKSPLVQWKISCVLISLKIAMVQTQGPDDALNSSKGKRLEVDSLVANAASVGCNLCALPSPIDIDDIVVQLGSHDVADSLRVVSNLRKSVKFK